MYEVEKYVSFYKFIRQQFKWVYHFQILIAEAFKETDCAKKIAWTFYYGCI